MIKANEIRIDNWFHHNSNWSYRSKPELEPFTFQWNDRDWYAVGECTMSLENLHPVRLTLPTLERAGFKLVSGSLTYISGLFELEFYREMFYINVEGQRLPLEHIKSVHQLQNIYYSLTGKELEINIPIPA